MRGYSDVLVQYCDLLAEVDTWFLKCSLAAGDQIACTRGCSACCRGLFDITLLDACLLNQGVMQLQTPVRDMVVSKARARLEQIKAANWPDFDAPWLLNRYPEDEWELVMPDEDETPCPLLGDDGLCRVYDNRPMTCRLHGIPLVDTSGEVLFDEWCSLNFLTVNPLDLIELRTPFNDIFKQEQLLFREFTTRLTGRPFNELDTLIPAAILIDFPSFVVTEYVWSPKTS